MAYTIPKSTSQNADQDNTEAMLECMKAMARGFKYVHGETEFQHLTDPNLAEAHPNLQKAVPAYGITIFSDKVVYVRYCPDADPNGPDNERISSRHRMESSMVHQSIIA